MRSLCNEKEEFGYNPDMFQKKLTNALIEKFPNYNKDYIKAFVQLIIDTNAGFISKETVKDYEQFCEKNGACCEGCPDLMGKFCKIYNRRPELCRLVPYWEVPDDEHGVHFWMGCPYAFMVIYMESVKILEKEC